jgi:hypothetical protein
VAGLGTASCQNRGRGGRLKLTCGPHASAVGGGRVWGVGRLGRWRLLGWAAADGVRPWGKSRGYKHTSLNWAAKLRRHWRAASGARLGEQGWAERRKRRVEGEGEDFAFF